MSLFVLGTETSRVASMEKDTPKKIAGAHRKDGSRDRGSEENHSKTIAVQVRESVVQAELSVN